MFLVSLFKSLLLFLFFYVGHLYLEISIYGCMCIHTFRGGTLWMIHVRVDVRFECVCVRLFWWLKFTEGVVFGKRYTVIWSWLGWFRRNIFTISFFLLLFAFFFCYSLNELKLINIYIYMYVCLCVCLQERKFFSEILFRFRRQDNTIQFQRWI